MDFIGSDLLSTTSGANSDGTVRAPRSASFNGPADRKSFSSLLQGVREGEKKGNTQEADSPQGSYKVEDRPNSKQGKGLNSEVSQTERSKATHARISDSEKLNDGQSQSIDGSHDESESALPQSSFGSAAEGQVFVSMPSSNVSQAGTQLLATEVDETHDGLGLIGRDRGASAESSPVLVGADASVLPIESHPLQKETAGLPSDGLEQAQDASSVQKAAEPHVKQSTELGGGDGENDVKGNVTDPVKTQATTQVSPSGGTISSSDRNVARLGETHDGKLLPENQLDRNLVALDRSEGSATQPSKDNQVHFFVPAPDDQGHHGPRSQELPPHGQQLIVDQGEPFSQSGYDHDGRQQGNPETKLFQGTIIDLQPMNGRITEQYAAVAQNQTISVPPVHSSTVVVPSVQPALQVAEVAQQPIASLLRSVVVDVVQPDLGHVNIRVAMMNDSVHAYFSTDRVEIGQFLINGQDRLQATLQASGLDIGQFRVDIDRQNGGRSFQQGLFQEQGQNWNQGPEDMGEEQRQGWPDNGRASLRGRVNLVA